MKNEKYQGDYTFETLGEIDMITYSNFKDIRYRYIRNDKSKVVIFQNLIVDGNFSLDWHEDFFAFIEDERVSVVIVRGTLEVRGNITNYGHGGLALMVMGSTKASNLISTGTLMNFQDVEIENIMLAAYEEGFVQMKSLKTKLLINDNHTILLNNYNEVLYSIDKNTLEYEEEQELAKFFFENKVLSKFVYVEEEDNEYFLDFNSMLNCEFFNGEEKKVLEEIAFYLK